jgi:hypothetical protein
MDPIPISQEERLLSQIEILVWSNLIGIVRVLKIHREPPGTFLNIPSQALSDWPIIEIIKYAVIGFSLGLVAGFLVGWIVLP